MLCVIIISQVFWPRSCHLAWFLLLEAKKKLIWSHLHEKVSLLHRVHAGTCTKWQTHWNGRGGRGGGAHTNVGAVGQMTYANIYTHIHTSQSSLCLNTCIILAWLDIVTMLQTPHCILLYTSFNLIGEVHMHPPCTPHNIPEQVCSGHPH